MFNNANTLPHQIQCNSRMELKRKGYSITCSSKNSQMYLFQMEMDFTHFIDDAKSLRKVLDTKSVYQKC